jgi:hypothetical protein
MTARVRKLIGGAGIILFLLFYVGAVVHIAALLPSNDVVKLAYFAIAGIGWGVPIIPLITWMNRGHITWR